MRQRVFVFVATTSLALAAIAGTASPVAAAIPETTIDSGPSGWIVSTSAVFTFSATEPGSIFQCRLDSGSFVSCSSPKAYTGLSEGSHTFYVQASDGSGNVDPTPASLAWSVDSKAPDTSIDSGPSGAVNGQGATFTFSPLDPPPSSGVAGYECRLDSGAWASCASPHSYSSLAEGTHTFQVRAGDVTGNVDQSPASRTWSIDLTPPDTTITDGPSGTIGPATAVELTAGAHTCALRHGGSIMCWGYNGFGQLGDESTTDRSAPVRVNGIIGATQIDAGSYHTCALLSNGSIACWGYGGEGELGDGTWSSRQTPIPVSGITDATQITAGNAHTCALLSAGSAQCWGYNLTGQVGDGSGTDRYAPVPVSGIASATQITAGGYHTCALLSDGSIRCWGNNSHGQLGGSAAPDSKTPVRVDGINSATQITAGGYHSCALLSDGSIRCWGNNGYGQLGDGTWNDSKTPVPVGGINNATQITAGEDHTCALLENGSVRCWGDNFHGALGDGTLNDSKTPVPAVGINDATYITAGGHHTCAVVSDGSVACWGGNWWGQLGDGTTASRSTPAAALPLPMAIFTVEGSEPGSLSECRMDGGTWASCYSPKGYSHLASGAHTFEARAIDSVGNPDPTPDQRTFDVDADAPNTAIDSGPSGTVALNTAQFGFSADEVGATFQCRLDARPWGVCSTPITYRGLINGAHTFSVRASDAFGNVDLTPASSTWSVDASPPETSIDSGPSGTATTPSVSFAFSSSDPAATFDCLIDAGSWSACVSPREYAGLATGDHTFQVRATDALGNTDASAASRTWILAAGTSVSISAPAKVSAGAKVRITGALSSADVSCVSGQQIALVKGTTTLGPRPTSASGTYVFRTAISANTKVQATFAGTPLCAASASVTKRIRVG